jgi:hypothetical protein
MAHGDVNWIFWNRLGINVWLLFTVINTSIEFSEHLSCFSSSKGILLVLYGVSYTQYHP